MERLTTPGGECISMGEPCCPDENCAEACLLMRLELANERLAAYEALGTIDDLTALVKARDEAETALKGAVDSEAN